MGSEGLIDVLFKKLAHPYEKVNPEELSQPLNQRRLLVNINTVISV